MTKRPITARLFRRGEEESGFDRDFWREAGPQARFTAAWRMITEVDLIRGGVGRQPRLQRSVAVLRRRGS